ncbi:MAG: hypothetical protein LPJ94_13655, partial [Thauera sp.]|nr:hypothetical protein [Thauera sp.]
SDSTTTTKHPHLSVVQFFKEPLHSLQQRSEIMISYPTTVKHLANLFFTAAPEQTRNADPHNTRLASPSTAASPSEEPLQR